MNANEPKKPKNNYFEDENRDKNKDFTEVLGLEQQYSDIIEKSMDENMTDLQRDFYRKTEILLAHREMKYLKHLRKVNLEGYVEYNKNLIEFCRPPCLNINRESFDSVEKNCVKNCMSKYINQFKVYKKSEDFLNQYGSEIFIFNDEEINAMRKMLNLMKLNSNNL